MPQDFNLDQFKATYFEECQELLEAAEEHLGELRGSVEDVDIEVLHAIFRCVHSIKGGAGAFNFTELVNFAHIFETLLDNLRERRVKVTEDMVEALLVANDILGTLVQGAQAEEDVDPSIWKQSAKDLEAYTNGETPKSVVQETVQPVEEKEVPKSTVIEGYNKTAEEEEEQGWGLFVDEEDLVQNAAETETPDDGFSPNYRITFIPERHLLRFANEPLLLSRELGQLGNCVPKVDVARLPDLDDIKPDEAYLSWVFEIQTDSSKEEIEEVFEFVVDDCELKIEQVTSDQVAQAKPTLKRKPVEEPVESEVTERIEQPKPTEIKTEAPSSVNVQAAPPVVENQTPVQKTKTTTEVSETLSRRKGDPKTTPSGVTKVSSIRVDLDRVDRLVNMVGELVITQAMLKQQAEDLAENAGQVMAQGFEDLSAHTRELQESVMAIRMQPVKSVFARMPRLVRELSSKLNKKIDLITTGEMTEVDKTVIEQLMDPLTHMIRNSIDHGVESHEERIAAGKPERASIHLSAEHRSGRIQIVVSDDGKGINRARVLEKAIEKGVIPEDHALNDEEVDNLIFAPGFSTADEVSDVSGRGVGMDVVRRNIVNLGGRISVFSTPGKGTSFRMSLPLTLAVLDGMIIKCGDEKYIIPLTAIIESIHPIKEELQNLVNGGVLVSVRGEYIPLVNLYRQFNVQNAITDPAQALVVIVETERFGHVGIMVDELLGQQQVVIKSLEENYDPIPGISAATILGNGMVSLILDVDGLAEMEHGAGRRRNFGGLGRQTLLTGEYTHGTDR